MYHLTDEKWLKAPNGDPRGYIDANRLSELWFHTGTTCNLRCPFCLEGSKPGDNRLNMITFEDALPFIHEALELGVEQFSFTGGEPFVVPGLIKILDSSLDHRPCLVLTNGTEPLMNRLSDLLPLLKKPQRLSFRISLDSPDAATHDAGRGSGNFKKSLRSLQLLTEHGFGVSVARQSRKGEDKASVDQAYQQHFAAIGLPRGTRIVAFPEFHTPGSIVAVPVITEDCMTRYHTSKTRADFMCASSKMVVKKEGRMRVYACTLVDDDPDYDLGGSLKDALLCRIMMKHHRCYSCFAYGASCSER